MSITNIFNTQISTNMKEGILFQYLLNIQWGKKVFSQPPIVQVLPLKKMREACNLHHRYTSTMRDKIRKIYLQIMVENKYLVNNKIVSILCYIPFVGNDRGQTFSVKPGSHCAIFNSLLRLLLVTLYEHDPHVKL